MRGSPRRVEPVEARHRDVEHGDGGRALGGDGERRFAVGHRGDVVALAPQDELGERADVLVVLGQQHELATHAGTLAGARSGSWMRNVVPWPSWLFTDISP